MQLHGLLSRASDLVEMGFEKGREMGEAAAKVAADTAKAAADTALAASSKSVMIEERQYLLLGLIAEGGFAYVYRARDAASGETLAVKKVIASDAKHVQASPISSAGSTFWLMISVILHHPADF